MSNDLDKKTADDFFNFVGRYVLAFQSIETTIDNIILLGKGIENWEQSQRYLAQNNFVKRKVRRAFTMLTNEEPFNSRSDDEWRLYLEDCNDRMLAECDNRARLLHSHFIWDFVEHGGPVIRSYREKTENGATFEQEELTKDVQRASLEKIAHLAVDYGQILTQCRHLIPD